MAKNLNFLGGSTSELSTEFSERRRFLEYFRSKGYPLLDTLYDKNLYGLINKQGEVVVPTKIIKTFDQESGTVQGLNYVVDMFNKLKKTFRDSDGLKMPQVLSELTPSKSYEDFDDNYVRYETLLANKLLPILVDTYQRKELTLQSFLDKLEEIVFSSGMSTYPMTKSGYALSENSSVYHTGLYIDMLPGQDASRDATKPDILEDPNFECYVGVCYEHGFMVDSNAPWRLILDLDSTMVKANILNGRPFSEFDSFFADVYNIKVGYDDYWSFRNFCEKLYIELHRALDKEISRIPNLQDSTQWIEFLLTCRMFELGLISKQRHKSGKLFVSTLERVMNINTVFGLSSNVGSLGFINNFCAQQLIKKKREYENFANDGHRTEMYGPIL